jgi:hypothetical protein
VLSSSSSNVVFSSFITGMSFIEALPFHPPGNQILDLPVGRYLSVVFDRFIPSVSIVFCRSAAPISLVVASIIASSRPDIG